MVVRSDILAHDRLRDASRAKLKSDIDLAKQALHPKTIATRWKAKQKARVDEARIHAERLVKKNAVLIAAMGVGALLFAARRPISRLNATVKTKMRRNNSAAAEKE